MTGEPANLDPVTPTPTAGDPPPTSEQPENDHHDTGPKVVERLTPAANLDPAAGREWAPGTYVGAAMPTIAEPGSYWDSPQAMLNDIEQHAKTTHGLASDKEMFLKIHGYLAYHLRAAGFDVA